MSLWEQGGPCSEFGCSPGLLVLWQMLNLALYSRALLEIKNHVVHFSPKN